MIKAQAYGHGIAVAPYIQPLVDCFMTATYEEAEEARLCGVYKPILVLGETRHAAICRDPVIIPAVSDAREAELLLESGCKNISVAVNTGMNRLGADERRLGEIAEVFKEHGCTPWSVYSHIYGGIATAGEQSAEFDRLTSSPIFSRRRHLYCSCALDLPGAYPYDMIRCGIAMYGYAKGLDIALKARAKIVAISSVQRGSHVGYGECVLDRDAVIATVRCGYADGVRRTEIPLYMKVRGVKCPIVGYPCMDLCMIDVTNAPCRVGEFAYLISEKEDAEYLAKAYGTIIYEVLTGFNGRAERIYV